MVSTGDGRLGWIAGAFYNDQQVDNSSREFTPNYDLFAIAEFGGVQPRPDSLEYFAVQEIELTETALFGELSYDITDDWQVVVGTRWYDYELDEQDAVDLPLYYTVFVGDRGPNDSFLDFVKVTSSSTFLQKSSSG